MQVGDVATYQKRGQESNEPTSPSKVIVKMNAKDFETLEID